MNFETHTSSSSVTLYIVTWQGFSSNTVGFLCLVGKVSMGTFQDGHKTMLHIWAQNSRAFFSATPPVFRFPSRENVWNFERQAAVNWACNDEDLTCKVRIWGADTYVTSAGGQIQSVCERDTDFTTELTNLLPCQRFSTILITFWNLRYLYTFICYIVTVYRLTDMWLFIR